MNEYVRQRCDVMYTVNREKCQTMKEPMRPMVGMNEEHVKV